MNTNKNSKKAIIWVDVDVPICPICCGECDILSQRRVDEEGNCWISFYAVCRGSGCFHIADLMLYAYNIGDKEYKYDKCGMSN